MKFGFMKGQGATEYLVLLAVVLIIALVSIALLGFFPGLAGDARKTQSDSYWRGEAKPFAILELSLASTLISAVFQNVESDTRLINNTQFGGSTGQVYAITANNSFAGGEKKTLYLTALTTACTVGTTYDIPLNITFNSSDLTNQKQISGKNIIVKCIS
jgi:hypothetical protein